MSPPMLSERQRSDIIAETERYLEQTHLHFSLKPKPVPVSFNVKSSAWGYFAQKGSEYLIRYNPYLFSRYFAEGIRDTIPHEVAHYAVARLDPGRRCKPHGIEWQNIMRLFGVENPRATHRSDVSAIPCRRQQRFSYTCACGDIELSATRHNRIQYKGAKYTCRKCGQSVEWRNAMPSA